MDNPVLKLFMREPKSAPAAGQACRRFRPVIGLAAAIALAGIASAAAADEIELNNQTATFTNLHGQVYDNVQLERATHDGLIYTATNTGTIGMVRYGDLPPDLLTRLKIPDSLVSEAARRQAALTLEKLRYDEASRLLALQQQTNAAAQATAAAAASQKSSPSQEKPAPPERIVRHHRHRR